jgi:hypothetical protein
MLAGVLVIGMLSVLAGPAQADLVFEDGFESGDLSAWDNAAAGRYAVTSDPDHVLTGDYALEGTIPAGDGWGELNKWFLPGYDEIWVRFSVMFEDGFQNLRSDGNGMHFFSVHGNRVDNQWSAHGQAGNVPDGTDFFATTVDPEHRYGDDTPLPLGFYTYYPDMTCCYGNLFLQDDPKLPLTTGVWHEIMVHVDAGTPGQADGLQQLWIDGRLVVDAQGIRWRDTDELTLNEIAVVDYMPGSPRTQHIWFDDFVVATEALAVGEPGSFADVPLDHVFADDVAWLADAGITLGCNPPDNTLFCPDTTVTRGQMAAFLHRALDGRVPVGAPVQFVDDDASVFEADIEWLAAAGITQGCGGDRFCPDQPVTRGQMAAFLTRALGLPPGSPDRFDDVEDSGFEAEIEALAEAGVTLGCNPPTNSNFCPDDPVTRAQMAAFLRRALEGG